MKLQKNYGSDTTGEIICKKVERCSMKWKIVGKMDALALQDEVPENQQNLRL